MMASLVDERYLMPDQAGFLVRLRKLVARECSNCAKGHAPAVGPHGMMHHGIWLCSAYQTHKRIASYLENPV